MSGMKKISLIISRSDIVNVLSELMDLECIEPTEPEVSMDPPELSDLIKHEVMELDGYEANMDSIVLLATQYTYVLTGWTPSQLEPDMASVLSGFACAWVLEDPYPYDYDDIPVLLKFPGLFGKLRSGGRRVFEPLARKHTI
jgi:vacuolar-type H+-ATPase subunit I/STV1